MSNNNTNYNIEDTGELLTRSKGGGRTKRMIIAAVAVVAVLAIALTGWKLVGDKRYNDQIEIAEKEFIEGNYEQAETEYLKAVAIKEREPKAREGLAYTYAVLDKFEDSSSEYTALYEDTKEEKYKTAAEETEAGKLPSNPELIPGRKSTKKDDPNTADTKAVYAAYAEVLEANADAIKKYWWQEDSNNKPMYDYGQYNYGDVVDNIISKNIVLYDLDGDGTDELLFVAQDDDVNAHLYCYTYRDGEAVECLCSNMDEFIDHQHEGATPRLVMNWAAAAGNDYIIYTGKEAGTFYIANKTGDAHDEYVSTQYVFEPDGSFTKTHMTWNYYESTDVHRDEYTVDGKSVSAEEGANSFKQHREDYDTLLMFSGHSKDFKIFEKVKTDTPIAMTYNEAMETFGE